MACYRHFTLAKDSSPGFGSTARNSPHPLQDGYTPYSDSLSLRLRLVGLTLLRTVTRRLIKQKARRHPVLTCART